MFGTQALLIGVFFAGGDSGTWGWSVSTSGEDEYWESPGTVRNDGESYDVSMGVNYAEATVLWGGIEWGPFDVTDMVPSEVYTDTTEGPCPTSFGTIGFVTPDPPASTTLAFDITTDLDESGQCEIAIDNIVLGTAEYELPWPIGVVTVQLVNVSMQAVVQLDVNGTVSPCPSDIDGNGAVETTDLLAVLGGWGECPSECPADINADGVVDVSDVLQIIADFGPC